MWHQGNINFPNMNGSLWFELKRDGIIHSSYRRIRLPTGGPKLSSYGLLEYLDRMVSRMSDLNFRNMEALSLVDVL